MKHLKYKFLNALYINLLLISCLGLCISCSDDTLGHVSIDSVWSNWLNEDKTTPESVRINTCYLGKWIALKGSGFSTLEGVYCNGYLCPVKEYNKTDNWLIVEIPWSVPMASEIDDENIKNTITVVTKNGESVYRKFVFKNPYLKPAVKSVSFTLPVAGQCITLNGENLHDASEIYFPGETEEIKGEIVNVDSYNVTVRVPAGNMTSGALRLVCVDESVYSPNYMYHTDGLLLSDEELYSEITPGSNCAVVTGQNNILSLTGLNTDSYCPENIICMPETPKALAKAAGYEILSGY